MDVAHVAVSGSASMIIPETFGVPFGDPVALAGRLGIFTRQRAWLFGACLTP